MKICDIANTWKTSLHSLSYLSRETKKSCYITLTMYEIFHSSFQEMLGECCNARSPWANRGFKKLRWQLKRKRHIQIELCVRVSALRLFQVGHVVQNKRSALSLGWHECFSCKGKE